MWAITSSSARSESGVISAATMQRRPAAKQSWRQSGTGRPRAASVVARRA